MKKIIAQSRRFLRKKGYDIIRHKELPEWLALHEIDIVLDIGANDAVMPERSARPDGPERLFPSNLNPRFLNA